MSFIFHPYNEKNGCIALPPIYLKTELTCFTYRNYLDIVEVQLLKFTRM